MKSKRYLFHLATLITLTLFITNCDNRKKGNDEKSVAKVGVIIPLTGQFSDYGKQMKNGVDLWMNDHPKSKIQIEFEDGEAIPKKSVDAFNLLITRNISCVVSGFSSVVLSMAPIANKNKIPLINAGATNSDIKSTSKYVFNVIPDADIEAKFIADFLVDSLKIAKCHIFFQNNDAGVGMRNNFEKEFRDKGGSIDLIIPHDATQTDYKNDLVKLKEGDPKTVFVPTYSKNLGLIIKQAKELGLDDILWVGYAASETNDLLSIAGKIIDGDLIYSYYEFNPEIADKSNASKFVKDYKTKFNEEPGLYSATFYDALSIIDSSLYSEKSIVDYIYSLYSFEGVSGNLVFDHKNYISSGMRMKMVINNQFSEFNKDELSHFNK